MPQPKKDAVHRYFIYDATNNASECQICAKNIKGKHTSNLKSHLAVKHTAEYKIVAEINNQTPAARKVTNSDANMVEKLKKYCMQLVTVHGRPLAMIEDEAFKNIINIVLPSNVDKQINIKAIKAMIGEQAYKIKQKIYDDIKNQLVCLKLDSATCAERRFIGINIQYIKNAEIVVRNLAVEEVLESQTGTFLKNTLESILTEFNITTEHLYCVCTDNGANMVKMVKLLGGKYCLEDGEQNEEYESSDDDDAVTGSEGNAGYETFFFEDFEVEDIVTSISDFKIRGMLCAAHTLQLAIKDAINNDISVQVIINLSRKIVNILRKPNITNKLKLLKLKKPINDCTTRWTATFNMLERLLALKEFCATLPELNSLISSNFWTEISSLLECLKPANTATIVLQHQNLTIGDFYIAWVKCKDQIRLINQPFAANLHNAMHEREKKLLKNDVVLECLYMDRRLNLILNEQECQRAKALLKESYQQLQKITRIVASENADPMEINTFENDLSSPCTSSGPRSLEERLMSAERVRGTVRQVTTVDICLNELKTAPRIPLEENIISHWNSRSVISSDIAMLANTVLSAPATQVSVERLFSSLKFIMHPLRSNLSATFLKDLMLIRENKDLID